MKKLIAMSMLAAALVALPAEAQVKFGLKGGLNVTTAKLDISTLDVENQTGFFVGPTLDIALLPSFGLDIAALYNERGLKLKDLYDGATDTQHLQYVDIPVNLKLNIGLGSMASVYVATGPQFSFYVGNEKTKDLLQTDQYKIKSSELSWNVGAGVKVLKHLGVGYNYNIALGKTAEVTADIKTAGSALWDSVQKDMKNRTHQVSLTYWF